MMRNFDSICRGRLFCGRVLWMIALVIVVAGQSGRSAAAQQVDVGPLLDAIRSVDADGRGHREASTAWRELSRAPAAQLPEILAGMKDANPLAMNWIRAVIETIVQRQMDRGQPVPVAALEVFLNNVDNEPRARRLAFELIARVDQGARDRLIPGLINDPSLELRRDAVAMALDEAQALLDAQKNDLAITAFRSALSSARDLDQIQMASERLKELKQAVDLPTHFGFVMRWYLIGPFDNRNDSGFNVAYPPETEINLTAQYDGQLGKVGWVRHTTTDEYGNVDLNNALGKHKGAVAYAVSQFHSNSDGPVELRLGCINANKFWLNGQLVSSNHVYHANSFIDQYTGHGQLRKGVNQILVKIAQNEQTEDWAQDWKFQLRVCDRTGTAILSQDRPLPKSAQATRPRLR